MLIKEKFWLILINIYTFILLHLVLINPKKDNGYIFIAFLVSINLALFVISKLSIKKEIRIIYIVGQPIKKFLTKSFFIDFSSQSCSIILTTLIFLILFKSVDFDVIQTLLFIMSMLSALKTLTFYIILRRILWYEKIKFITLEKKTLSFYIIMF